MSASRADGERGRVGPSRGRTCGPSIWRRAADPRLRFLQPVAPTAPAAPQPAREQFRPAVHAEVAVHPVNLLVDGAGGDAQPRGDLLLDLTAQESVQDLPRPLRQLAGAPFARVRQPRVQPGQLDGQQAERPLIRLPRSPPTRRLAPPEPSRGRRASGRATGRVRRTSRGPGEVGAGRRGPVDRRDRPRRRRAGAIRRQAVRLARSRQATPTTGGASGTRHDRSPCVPPPPFAVAAWFPQVGGAATAAARPGAGSSCAATRRPRAISSACQRCAVRPRRVSAGVHGGVAISRSCFGKIRAARSVPVNRQTPASRRPPQQFGSSPRSAQARTSRCNRRTAASFNRGRAARGATPRSSRGSADRAGAPGTRGATEGDEGCTGGRTVQRGGRVPPGSGNPPGRGTAGNRENRRSVRMLQCRAYPVRSRRVSRGRRGDRLCRCPLKRRVPPRRSAPRARCCSVQSCSRWRVAGRRRGRRRPRRRR